MQSHICGDPPATFRSQPNIPAHVAAKLTRLSSSRSITMSRPSELHFSQFSPERVAKAMHSHECEMFQRIETSEFHHLGWSSEARHEKSPNVVAMIERFNLVNIMPTSLTQR